ncbi:MAG: glucose 1-dehydrogenase [Chloroflexi bacterium]|nr:glucose 1-dehydrogenase [Chloroflexota bacterium]
MENLFSLNGKVALVTGGGRGLGEAIATALAEYGADVALAGRTLPDLEDVATRLRALGRRSQAFQVDVTRVESIERLAKEVVAAFGRIDILVNNAGLNIIKCALDVTEEDWDRILDTNLKGTFFCCQAVGRVMVAQNHGRIVNIASQMAKVGWYKRSAYCASKGGVAQLTKVLAVEWAQNNVTVNAVAPTFIETQMTAKMFEDEQFRQSVLDRIPLGRLGKPKDVAAAVIYLASEAGDLVTGSTLLVDGGWTAW